MAFAMHILGLKAGWLACVFGAADGRSGIGIGVVGLHLAWHLGTSPDRRREAGRMAGAALFGLAADSGLARAGVFDFADALPVEWVSPPWMVALWTNLSTAVDRSLAFLHGRPLLASLLGAVAGPLAYAGGAAAGALTWSGAWALGIVALEYAIAVPGLFLLSGRPIREPHT